MSDKFVDALREKARVSMDHSVAVTLNTLADIITDLETPVVTETDSQIELEKLQKVGQ
jgi:hypothetical protein